MTEWLPLTLLFLLGIVTGALNVVAGGGSFLTLPVLIFMGLPPVHANGTNRVGILAQNVGAVWGFHRHRVMPWKWALGASLPAVAGAVFGTWLALEVGAETFKKALAFFMVAISLTTLVAPMEARSEPRPMTRARMIAFGVGFFVVGIYCGFVQAGAGFLILAVTSFAGFDLVRGNAVKVLAIMLLTIVSLGIFAWQGVVEWLPGIVLGVGNLLGGLLGVRLTVLKGHKWVKAVVTAAVIVFAVKLWFD